MVGDVGLKEEGGMLRGEANGKKRGEGFFAEAGPVNSFDVTSQGMEVDDRVEELMGSFQLGVLREGNRFILEILPLAKGT